MKSIHSKLIQDIVFSINNDPFPINTRIKENTKVPSKEEGTFRYKYPAFLVDNIKDY